MKQNLRVEFVDNGFMHYVVEDNQEPNTWQVANAHGLRAMDLPGSFWS